MKGFLAALKPWGATIVTVAMAATLPALIHATPDGNGNEGNYVKGSLNKHGKIQMLLNDRNPALYTGKFGDCKGGHSLLDITGFDAAYYKDNMTVMFHLTGSTMMKNESIMGMAQTLARRLPEANHCYSVHLCRCLYGNSMCGS
jgi:hypothetical protein